MIENENVILNNRYKLEERLGSGGMAVVYRAHDLMLERKVAIKILRENFSNDPTFRERFRQEARAAANLSHPNIVTVHDFGLDSGRLFIVMENVPGTDLKSILQKRGRLPMDDALTLMVQACAGVGYAHRAGLVHCDIKPHNMLITPDKRLKVTDFGIARALASIQPEEKTDVVWGSPQYFAPEQAAGGPPSPASDVYSLGIVLFEMLTGQLPFSGSSATELAQLHRETPAPPIRELDPAIPATLEQILLKVLAKEPSARYRTADQLGRVLVTFTQQSDAAKIASVPKFPSIPEPDHSKSIPEPPTPTIQRQIYSQPPSLPRPIPAPISKNEDNPLDIDWLTLGLLLLALIAVGGLIPFFTWVFFLYQ